MWPVRQKQSFISTASFKLHQSEWTAGVSSLPVLLSPAGTDTNMFVVGFSVKQTSRRTLSLTTDKPVKCKVQIDLPYIRSNKSRTLDCQDQHGATLLYIQMNLHRYIWYFSSICSTLGIIIILTCQCYLAVLAMVEMPPHVKTNGLSIQSMPVISSCADQRVSAL